MDKSDSLKDWGSLNRYLMLECREASEVFEILEMEKSGKCRLSFLRRIHSRYSVLRNRKEIKELTRVGKII